jgi:hypothetical protein
MNTTVIHNAAFNHFITASFHRLRNTPSEKNISQMTEMQRFIGIGGGVLHHYLLAVGWFISKSFLIKIRLKKV